MKKFLVAAAAALMLVTTTAPAKAGSDWVAPAIFGTIFGVIIANNHGHADTVVVERRPRHRYHRRHWNRHPRPIWVEKCGPVGYGGRDKWGDYTILHRHECRMVRKMRW